MARFQHKRLDQPDELRPFPSGRTEIFELDDFVVGRMVMEPGWRWTRDVRPIAGTDRCMYHHLGYCVSGELHIELEDGTTGVITKGEMFELPPGHEAWVEEGGEPWIAIDFRGARSYARPVAASADRILATVLFAGGRVRGGDRQAGDVHRPPDPSGAAHRRGGACAGGRARSRRAHRLADHGRGCPR
jgi:hypothetical protein